MGMAARQVIDTLKYSEDLIASGMPEIEAKVCAKQSEALAETLLDLVASKEDLNLLRIETKEEINLLKVKIEAVDHKIDVRVGAVESKLNWLIGLGSLFSTMIALLIFIRPYLSHFK